MVTDPDFLASDFDSIQSKDIKHPHVIQDVHFFISSVENKIRFLKKTFQDFSLADFNGNQQVEGPN